MSPNSFVVVWLWMSNTRLVAFGMNFLQPSPCLPPYGSLPVILLVKTLLFLFSFSKKSLPQHRHFFSYFPKTLFSICCKKKKIKTLPSLLNFVEVVVEAGFISTFFLQRKDVLNKTISLLYTLVKPHLGRVCRLECL